MSHSSAAQIVRPARTVRGSVRLPGDKSISHRYALLAGLAEGTSRFSNFPPARTRSSLDRQSLTSADRTALCSAHHDGDAHASTDA